MMMMMMIMMMMVILISVMRRVMMIMMMATWMRAGKLMQISAGVFAGIRIGPSDASDFLRVA